MIADMCKARRAIWDCGHCCRVRNIVVVSMYFIHFGPGLKTGADEHKLRYAVEQCEAGDPFVKDGTVDHDVHKVCLLHGWFACPCVGQCRPWSG